MKKLIPVFLIVLLIIYMAVALFRPVPKVKANITEISSPPGGGVALVWPANTQQSAIGAQNYGLLAIDGKQESHPIASIAKCMVALGVLEKKPLNKGEQGPILTMTAQDVNYYTTDLAQNGSVVPVQIGEQLTEYQMLQALLIPSGDNIATTLADWAFGSLDNYLNYANQASASWQMSQTHFADASGLSAQTVSSAQDLIILGEKIMANPVLSEIVSQNQITLPVAGKVNNYNTLLGQNNIVGIKTGNTDEAGGCFLFATRNNINGQDVLVIGVILGAQSRNAALQSTKSFILRNNPNFKVVTVVKAGQTIGVYHPKWGPSINAVAKSDLNVLVATTDKISTNIDLPDLSTPQNQNSEIGTISAKIGLEETSVPIVLDVPLDKPSIFYRLIHP